MYTPTPGVEQLAYGRGKVDGQSGRAKWTDKVDGQSGRAKWTGKVDGAILSHFAGNQNKTKHHSEENASSNASSFQGCIE